MNVINHVDLDKVQSTVTAMKSEPGKAKRVNRIEGIWICEGSQGPQFKADIQLENGKFTLEADSPSFLGGTGTSPGPLHYCIFGLTSCFASTFMTIAAIEGIRIDRAKFVGECNVDFSKTLGLSDRPIIENAKFKVTVKSNAPEETLRRLSKLAEERCPGMYSLVNRISVETEVYIE